MDSLCWSCMELTENEAEIVSQVKRCCERWFEEQAKAIGPYSRVLKVWCGEPTIARYCRARRWVTTKAWKMLRATLEWRSTTQPELLTWEQVKGEGVKRKMYNSQARDLQDRPLVVLCPGRQSGPPFDVNADMTYFIYSMESALSRCVGLTETPTVARGAGTDLSPEKVIFCVDFRNYLLKNQPPMGHVGTFMGILQGHYPERLAMGILYDAPTIFSIFWNLIWPFLDAATASKMQFLYPPKAGHRDAAMAALFDLDRLEINFGGNLPFTWDPIEYGNRMKEEDAARLRVVHKLMNA